MTERTATPRDERPLISAGREEGHPLIAAPGADEEPRAANQRALEGWQGPLLFWSCVVYTVFHLLVLNVFPMETWAYRLLHVAGALMIGFGLMATRAFEAPRHGPALTPGLERAAAWAAGALGLYALVCVLGAYVLRAVAGMPNPPPWVFATFG
ncbi:MAG TPA: hypothetical protein VLA62_02100, partial [Solirubrobacterales bacterium]|nr:hypothetical protein [Solirubrobacterales bacterium]